MLYEFLIHNVHSPRLVSETLPPMLMRTILVVMNLKASLTNPNCLSNCNFTTLVVHFMRFLQPLSTYFNSLSSERENNRRHLHAAEVCRGIQNSFKMQTDYFTFKLYPHLQSTCSMAVLIQSIFLPYLIRLLIT